jgi:DNA-directed RNA polymerase alpha subunit
MAQLIRCPHCGKIAAFVGYANGGAPSEDDLKNCSRPIESYPWSSARIANVLRSARIETFRDLCLRHERDLLVLPNLYTKSVEEIKRVLAGLGMRLSDRRFDEA